MEAVTGHRRDLPAVARPETLAGWYAQHLGLPVAPGDATAELPWTGPGSTIWAAFPHDTEYFGHAERECMLNFRVADLDAMLLQLKAAGVRVEPDIEESAYGRFGWTVDPEGRRIELWEPPGPPRPPTDEPGNPLA